MKKSYDMTNAEFAAQLRSFADLYDAHPTLRRGYGLTLYVDTKEEVRSILKSIGGKWGKEVDSSMRDYPTLTFTHHGTGLQVRVSRECRKIVTYDCEPIMSSEEEAELMAEE